jgi:MYXO-CTERM domain-containing protein
MTFLGCVPTEGWAPDPGDCRPDDPTINPGAEEVCNGWDDNCDARVDEFVRPRCGEGWCRREAQTCDPQTCTPGEPRDEECNLLDDDCDAQLDEGSCPEGQECRVGVCEVEEDDDDDASGSGSGPEPTGGEVGTGTATDTDGVAMSDGSTGCGCGAGAQPTFGLLWLLALAMRRRD